MGKKKRVRESLESIYGTPVDWYNVLTMGGRIPLHFGLMGTPTRQDRPRSIRTLQELTYVQQRSRHLVETNPNAAGALRGLINYVFKHTGSDWSIALTEPIPTEDLNDSQKGMIQAGDLVLKAFHRENRWGTLEREWFERLLSDGESFLRLFPDEDNITKVRFVEPWQIKPPNGESEEGVWSFGIYTPDHDNMRPSGYNVYDPLLGFDEFVEPQFIIHTKINTNSNIKRGLPEFYAVDEDLRGAAKLRKYAREGEAVRSSIAYIRQMTGTPTGGLQALQTASETHTLSRFDGDGQRRPVSVEQIEPGSVVDINHGEYKEPPRSPNSEASGRNVMMALQAASARMQIPSWLLSGESDAANYATALVAESPFTINVLCWQGNACAHTVELYRRVIEIAGEQGELPANYLDDEYEVQVILPDPTVRDPKAQQEVVGDQLDRGMVSMPTARAAVGLDHDREEANIQSQILGGGKQ